MRAFNSRPSRGIKTLKPIVSWNRSCLGNSSKSRTAKPAKLLDESIAAEQDESNDGENARLKDNLYGKVSDLDKPRKTRLDPLCCSAAERFKNIFSSI